MSAASCIADVLAEHAEELPFDLSRRRAVVRSALHTCADLARLDARISARLDGLALGGAEIAALAAPLLAQDDGDAIAAGALIALAAGAEPDCADIAIAARSATGSVAVASALALWPHGLPARIAAWLTSSDPSERLTAVEAFGHRGQTPPWDERLLGSVDNGSRWRVARWAPIAEIERLLSDEDPRVRGAALESAAWNGWAGLREHCRNVCSTARPDRLDELRTLAVLAQNVDREVLLARCCDPAFGPARFSVAASWAHPTVAPALLAGISSADADEATAAGAAFARMFAVAIDGERVVVEPPADADAFDRHFAAERVLPDPQLAQRYWREVCARLDRCERIVCGEPEQSPLARWDLLSRWESRLRAAADGGASHRHETSRLTAR